MIEKRPDLGILTCRAHPPFIEESFFCALTRFAKRKGLSVIVFSPKQADLDTGYVSGHQYTDGKKKWTKKRFPIPRLLYDRCFYTSSAHYREYKPFVHRLQQYSHSRFLGIGLPGKWAVYRMLSHSGQLTEFLPLTIKVSEPMKVIQYVQKNRDIILKPAAGSLGLGVTHISLKDDQNQKYYLEGRNRKNRPFNYLLDEQGLLRWLQGVLKRSRTIVQPYLSLHTPDRTPFDIRVLTQKNGSGNWEAVGGAVRIGQKNGLTSNLHGGGTGTALRPFLSRTFAHQAASIEKQIEYLAQSLPVLLEKSHGPLVELGLDIGVDTAGQVWVIEVNSKPGRNVFRQLNEPEIQRKTVANLVNYACHLLERETEERGFSNGNNDLGYDTSSARAAQQAQR